ENGEQCRLAASGRPADGDVLAFADLQMHFSERVRLHLVGVEHLGDPVEADERWVAIAGRGERGGSGRCGGRHSIRTLLALSHADMSEMITLSPALSPARTSIVVTEARPNDTLCRTAVRPLASSLNNPTVASV